MKPTETLEIEEQMSFWEHLDVLRIMLLRVGVVIVACGVVAFLFKDEVFGIVLAPRSDSFVTYRLFDALSRAVMPSTGADDFSVQLINTGLSAQFMIHMKTSVWVGCLLASPYVLYSLFRFVSPALRANEQRHAVRFVGGGYALFMLGVAVSYFLIFPFTFKFLGTYQVSADVTNMITLQSYVGTLMTLSLMMGLVFELPLLCWTLGRMGLLSADTMRHYRKHAVIIILVVAAIITPTSDVFTLTLVALPMWLLYEVGVLLVPRQK